MNLFSIIVPVYNAEKTIRRCLDSFLSQIYENFEVLLIDDGSIDNSLSIVLEYANKDERFKVFSQTNAGPSSARNLGLTLAKGDIVAFVDSDDYVDKTYLLRINKTFNENDVDVAFIGFKRVTGDGKIISIHDLPELTNDYYENILSLSKADMFGYTWIKVIKREIIGDIKFDEKLNLFEDEVFTCNLLTKPRNMTCINENLYFYVKETNSSLTNKTHIDYCLKCESVYQAWNQLLDMYENKNLVLESKSNHMVNNCKYYGLERKASPFSFYKDLSKCDFFKKSTISDKLIDSIRKNSKLQLIFYIIEYKVKNKISLILKKYWFKMFHNY